MLTLFVKRLLLRSDRFNATSPTDRIPGSFEERKKHDHVTPLLKELHWLPIHVRPTYKLLTIAYSVMHGLAPEYLAELLDRHHPRRVLRSAFAELFSVPFSQTVRHGDRRFSVAVATLWNQLPNSLRRIETLPLFRTHLKTHLFRGAFS